MVAGGREEVMVSSREKQRCQVASGLGGFWDTGGAMAGNIQERARTPDGKKLEVGRTFRAEHR